jgi:hypothetical protein
LGVPMLLVWGTLSTAVHGTVVTNGPGPRINLQVASVQLAADGLSLARARSRVATDGDGKGEAHVERRPIGDGRRLVIHAEPISCSSRSGSATATVKVLDGHTLAKPVSNSFTLAMSGDRVHPPTTNVVAGGKAARVVAALGPATCTTRGFRTTETRCRFDAVDLSATTSALGVKRHELGETKDDPGSTHSWRYLGSLISPLRIGSVPISGWE